MNDDHLDSSSAPPSEAGPPVHPLHPIELPIERLTRRGIGLAFWAERPVFVPGVDAGERVRVVLSEHRNRLTGHVLEVLQPSLARRPPDCPHASQCPGCQLRHLTDGRQQQLALERIRGLVHRALAMEIPWTTIARAPRDGARSRVVARALTNAQGLLSLGMADSKGDIVPLGQCPVQSPATQALVRLVERELRIAGFYAFDPRTQTGTIRHVFAEASPTGSRVVIALAHCVPDQRFDALLASQDNFALAVDVLPKRGAGTFSAPRALRGGLDLTLEFGGDRLRATLPAWTPQAPATVDPLRETVLEWLAPATTDQVVEVGCGIGTLSLPIARIAARFIGIDKNRQAIMDAQANADRAGVTGSTFWVGDARHGLRRLLAKGEHANLVLLHAMRRPYGPEVMSAIRALSPRRVVYLAPNPMALADDLHALVYGQPRQKGPPEDRFQTTPGHDTTPRRHATYALTRGGIVDQAPGTTDFLSVVLLEALPPQNQPREPNQDDV